MTNPTNNYYMSVCCIVCSCFRYFYFSFLVWLVGAFVHIGFVVSASENEKGERSESVGRRRARACVCMYVRYCCGKLFYDYRVWRSCAARSIAILRTKHAEIINGMNWWLLAVATTPMRERLFHYSFHSIALSLHLWLSLCFIRTLLFSR